MQIILYSTGCPRCKVLTKKLQAKQLTFEVCDDISVMERKGIVSVPVLEVEGQLMNFSEANQWVGEQS